MEKAQKIELITKKANIVDVNQNIQGEEIIKDKDLLGQLQNILKRKGKLYYFILDLFSPVLSSFAYKKAKKRLLRKYDQEPRLSG